MERFGTTFYSEAQLRHGPTALFKSRVIQESILEGRVGHQYDVFLSHSSQDKRLVIGFKEKLEARQLSVYIDWLDDSDTNRDSIAPKLKDAMEVSENLLYLHTHHSRRSVWTPWEIGFFDAYHGPDKVGVVPLLDDERRVPSYRGHEYLTLYPEIGVDYFDDFLRSA